MPHLGRDVGQPSTTGPVDDGHHDRSGRSRCVGPLFRASHHVADGSRTEVESSSWNSADRAGSAGPDGPQGGVPTGQRVAKLVFQTGATLLPDVATRVAALHEVVVDLP